MVPSLPVVERETPGIRCPKNRGVATSTTVAFVRERHCYLVRAGLYELWSIFVRLGIPISCLEKLNFCPESPAPVTAGPLKD